MNRGLVAGRVFNSNGKGANGAHVFVDRVYGGGGLLGIEWIETYSDSKGKFALPFVWSGNDFSRDLSVISIHIVAYSEEEFKVSGRRSGTKVLARAKGSVPGVLRKDIIGLTNMATSNFDGIAEIADFAIDIGKALAGWNNLVPFWKTNIYTSESWLILGAVNIYLIDY